MKTSIQHIAYSALQKKYAGQLVALSESGKSVVAASDDVQSLEKKLQQKGIDPETCLILGPIEAYKQISVY